MAEEGVQLSRELAEIVREMARKYKAHGWPTQSTNPPMYYPEGSIIFVNRSGEEIPAYACMQVTGTIEEDGRTLLEVDKPNAATLVNENQLLFNGSRAIADDENGSAQNPSIVKAFKDSAETIDDPGDGWSYTDGEWYLSPGGAFTYYGTSDIDDDVIIVKCPTGSASLAYFYPPSGGIPAATYNTTTDTLTTGSAVCTKADKVATGIYEPGETTDTVENIASFVVGASGRPMACSKNTYGRWVVVVEDCGSSTSTGTGGPTPQPDVGEKSSSSRSIDMGYSLGV